MKIVIDKELVRQLLVAVDLATGQLVRLDNSEIRLECSLTSVCWP